MKKKNKPFKEFGNIAIGTAGLGVGLGVAGAINAKSVSMGAPNMGASIGMVGSFAPIAVTGMAGHTVLKTLKKKKGKY